MKHNPLYIIPFSLVIIALTIASCASDEGFTPASYEPVKVLSTTGNSIPAAGGEQTIEIEGNVSRAYSKDSWLTVNSNGASIGVSAPANDSREKRNTILVIKTSDKDSIKVAVSQEGMVLAYQGDKLIVHEYKDTVNCSVYVNCNEMGRLKILSQPEWLQARVDSDSIRMKIDPNYTIIKTWSGKQSKRAKDMRMGYVRFGIGDIVDSIKVIQYNYTNFNGDNWMLLGYPVRFYSDGSYYIDQTQVIRMTGEMDIDPDGTSTFTMDYKFFTNLPTLTLTLDYKFIADSMKVSFNNGQFLGHYGDSIYIAETLIGSGYIRSFSTAPTGCFNIDVDDDGLLSARITGAFPYNGGNLDIIGLWFCAFKEEEFTSDSYYGQGSGDIIGIMPCYLVRPKSGSSTAKIIERLNINDF